MFVFSILKIQEINDFCVFPWSELRFRQSRSSGFLSHQLPLEVWSWRPVENQGERFFNWSTLGAASRFRGSSNTLLLLRVPDHSYNNEWKGISLSFVFFRNSQRCLIWGLLNEHFVWGRMRNNVIETDAYGAHENKCVRIHWMDSSVAWELPTDRIRRLETSDNWYGSCVSYASSGYPAPVVTYSVPDQRERLNCPENNKNNMLSGDIPIIILIPWSDLEHPEEMSEDERHGGKQEEKRL